MYRSLLVACVLVTLTGSVRTASADDIPCPVQKATWSVKTPLPDPWSGPTEAGTLVKQVSAFINARDWIICIYANDNDLDNDRCSTSSHIPASALAQAPTSSPFPGLRLRTATGATSTAR